MNDTGTTAVKRQSSFVSKAESLVTDLHVLLYRLSGGGIGGKFGGAPVLLLTTTGRKTGKKRTKPLLYLMDNEQVVLVASHGGAPSDPGWWRNLKQHPQAEIEIKRTRLQVEAREATEEEREHLWPKVVALYPNYEDYQKRTTRTIPVVILQRTSQAGQIH